MASINLSPGVFTQEQDFTIYAAQVGITKLGIVGNFLMGPAFVPTSIATTDQFASTFGATDPFYPAAYVANYFLGQSNQLTVTRILGTAGFTNSPAWLIVSSSGSTFPGVVLGVLRSKLNQITNTYYLNNPTDLKIGLVTSATTPLSTYVERNNWSTYCLY